MSGPYRLDERGKAESRLAYASDANADCHIRGPSVKEKHATTPPSLVRPISSLPAAQNGCSGRVEGPAWLLDDQRVHTTEVLIVQRLYCVRVPYPSRPHTHDTA